MSNPFPTITPDVCRGYIMQARADGNAMVTVSMEAWVDRYNRAFAAVGDDTDNLLIEKMQLELALSRAERACRALVRSARRASGGQDLVLRSALLEIAREVGEPLNTA